MKDDELSDTSEQLYRATQRYSIPPTPPPGWNNVASPPASVMAFLRDSGWTEVGGRCVPPAKYAELNVPRFEAVSWNTALAYEVFQRMTLGSYNNE